MVSSKAKIFVIIAVLLLAASITAVGCGKKSEGKFVNTETLPGNTFKEHSSQGQSAIVYLGSDNKSSDVNFGPRDISFEFRELKR